MPEWVTSGQDNSSDIVEGSNFVHVLRVNGGHIAYIVRSYDTVQVIIASSQNHKTKKYWECVVAFILWVAVASVSQSKESKSK